MTLFRQPIFRSNKGSLRPLRSSKKQATLIVGDDGCSLIAFDRKRRLQTHFISPGQDIVSQVVEHTKSWQTNSLRLVSNQIGQSYAREDIPPAAQRDRNAILERRISARFGADALTTFVPLKAAKQGGSEELSYLFAAIGVDSNLHLLIDELDGHGLAISSVSLLPLEWANLISTLLASASTYQGADLWRVVVTRHRTGGTRHIVLHKDELILTRLTTEFASSGGVGQDTANFDRPTRDASGPARASHTFQEIKASIGYIKRFGYTPEQPLAICLVGGDDFEQVSQFGAAGSHGQWEVHDPADLAKRVRLDLGGGEGNEFADNLVGGLLCTKHSRFPLQSPKWTGLQSRKRQLRMVKGSLYAAAAALITILIGTGFEIYQSAEAIESAEVKLLQLKTDFEKLNEKSQELPADMHQIGEFLSVYRDQFAKEGQFAKIHKAIARTVPIDVRLVEYSLSVVDKEFWTIEAELDLERLLDLNVAKVVTENWIEKIRSSLPNFEIDILSMAVPIEPELQSTGSWNVSAISEATSTSTSHLGHLEFTVKRQR